MFFNVPLHIFTMLQYLQPNIALHSFSICFVMLQLKCFMLFWDMGTVEERGALEKGGQERGGQRRTWVPFYFVPCAGAGGVP